MRLVCFANGSLALSEVQYYTRKQDAVQAIVVDARVTLPLYKVYQGHRTSRRRQTTAGLFRILLRMYVLTCD